MTVYQLIISNGGWLAVLRDEDPGPELVDRGYVAIESPPGAPGEHYRYEAMTAQVITHNIEPWEVPALRAAVQKATNQARSTR